MRRTLLTGLVTYALVGCASDPITVDETPFIVDSPAKVVEALERAYRARDHAQFVQLLANHGGTNAEFVFLLGEKTEHGEDRWGHATEDRIHRRMFDPRSTPAGERPVPSAIWLNTVDIHLTRASDFEERADLYSRDEGHDGLLVPEAWRATSALYSTDVFFGMDGETDYLISGQSEFVVIEDLTKDTGDPGRFLLYSWADLGSPEKQRRSPTGVEDGRWSAVKMLYR